ncbi:MAG: STAS domain-containing protein [Chitinophagaceae bacterium]
MKVKIDTKEKFHVITLEEEVLAANMTEKLRELLQGFKTKTPRHVVVNLGQVKVMDKAFAGELTQQQQVFYENNSSLVICELANEVESFLDKNELLEIMNVTPTESEAGDIVQMEEIERELLDGSE